MYKTFINFNVTFISYIIIRGPLIHYLLQKAFNKISLSLGKYRSTTVNE